MPHEMPRLVTCKILFPREVIEFSTRNTAWHHLWKNAVIIERYCSFYRFRMIVTHATFGFLAIAAFLVSNNILTADQIRGEIVAVVKGDHLLSRLNS